MGVEGEKELLHKVVQHCKRFSLPVPVVLEAGESIASQEQMDDLKRVLFHLGVNPLL